jgi:hypothetical protein
VSSNSLADISQNLIHWMIPLNCRPDLSWRSLLCFFLLILFSMCSPLIQAFILRYLFLILSWGMHQCRARSLILFLLFLRSHVTYRHCSQGDHWTSSSSTSSRSTCSLGEPLVSSNTTSLETSTKPDDLLKTLYDFVFKS